MIVLGCLEGQGAHDSSLELAKIYFCPSPKELLIKPGNKDGVKKNLKVPLLYMTIFESAGQFLLSLVRPNFTTQFHKVVHS